MLREIDFYLLLQNLKEIAILKSGDRWVKGFSEYY